MLVDLKVRLEQPEFFDSPMSIDYLDGVALTHLAGGTLVPLRATKSLCELGAGEDPVGQTVKKCIDIGLRKIPKHGLNWSSRRQ